MKTARRAAIRFASTRPPRRPDVYLGGDGRQRRFRRGMVESGQDGEGWGVYGQRFDASGTAVGQEFQVNTTTSGDQLLARVATDASGNFTVVWQSQNQQAAGTSTDNGSTRRATWWLGIPGQHDHRAISTMRISHERRRRFRGLLDHDGQDGQGGGIFAKQ